MITTKAPLELTRAQILAHRRRVGALDERLPMGAASLRRAAWAGLQDSMPRAALLSLHARVRGTGPATWEHPSLAQLWGPRFSAYVVAVRDFAIFSLGRLPDDGAARRLAQDLGSRLAASLAGATVTHAEAARRLRLPHANQLRYGAATGTIRIRWDGAHDPTVWSVPAPEVDPSDARRELARRYLHVVGPGTASSFARWAGIGPERARAAFAALTRSLIPVRTPIGDGWILSSDERSFRDAPAQGAPARLLPSGDTYFLLHGADRTLLVPDARRRTALWTTRVWPGAILALGELVGTWRRAGAEVTLSPWRRLARAERDAVVAEADSLPLPGRAGRIRVRWE